MSKYTLHKIPANQAFTTNVSYLKELSPEFARVSQGLRDSKSNAGAVGIFGGPETISPVLHGASSSGNYNTTYGHSEREGMREALKKLIQQYGKDSPFPNYHNKQNNSLENAQSYTEHATEYQKSLEKNGHIVNIWSEWPPCAGVNKSGGGCNIVLNSMLPSGSHVAHTAGINGYNKPPQQLDARKDLIKTWEQYKQQKPQQVPIFSLQPQSSTQYLGGFGGFGQTPVQLGFNPSSSLFQQQSNTGYSGGFGQSYVPQQPSIFQGYKPSYESPPRNTKEDLVRQLNKPIINSYKPDLDEEEQLSNSIKKLALNSKKESSVDWGKQDEEDYKVMMGWKSSTPPKKQSMQTLWESKYYKNGGFVKHLPKNKVLEQDRIKRFALTPEETRIAEIFNMSPAEYKRLQNARFKNQVNLY